MSSLKEVCEGLPLNPLPPRRPRDEDVAHAPVRTPSLTREEVRVGVILYFFIYAVYTIQYPHLINLCFFA